MYGGWAYTDDFLNKACGYGPSHVPGPPGTSSWMVDSVDKLAEEVAWADTVYPTSLGPDHCMAYPLLGYPNQCNWATLGNLDKYTIHNGGSCLAFYDGHVKWHRSAEILARF